MPENRDRTVYKVVGGLSVVYYVGERWAKDALPEPRFLGYVVVQRRKATSLEYQRGLAPVQWLTVRRLPALQPSESSLSEAKRIAREYAARSITLEQTITRKRPPSKAGAQDEQYARQHAYDDPPANIAFKSPRTVNKPRVREIADAR